MRRTDISQYGNISGRSSSASIKKPKRSKKSMIKNSAIILKRIFLSALAIMILTGFFMLAFLNYYKSSLMENDISLNINASKLSLTSFIYVNDNEGRPQEYQRVHNSENRVWVDFQDIPQTMKDAVVAIEDKRFYEHRGVDWKRTIGAVLNLLKGTQGYGGSTLTQQLIKNITEDNEVSLSRKAREIFRALQLEQMYSKDEILEAYLNVVNFGSGCRGVQAAANVYFDKNIQDCSVAQCAAIAGITQNPTAFNPLYHPENNRTRRETVLYEMFSQNKISQETYQQALKESAEMDFSKARKTTDNNKGSATVYNWYMETVVRDVVNDLQEKYHIGKSAAEDMLYTQGLKIYSAMDLNAQNYAEKALHDASIMPKDPNMQLGYIMMDWKGRVLATLGSRKEKTANLLYDRANVARRQPGSTIKPLSAYAPAIDWGVYNYSSLIPDEPLHIDSAGNNTVKNWPVNWYKSYRGKVTLQWALEKSANAPVAQVIKLLTPAKVYEFLTQKLGFTNLDSNDAISLAALATGGTHYGVTPREMVAAFEIFGNAGKYTKPFTYFYVTDRNDKVILDNRKPQQIQAISPESASIMNRLLRNVVIGAEGTGRAANIPGWEIIAKTGTTTGNYDSWFIGGSPYAIAGIWTGYDNPKRIAEASPAKRIWKYIMSNYLSKKPNVGFALSENVVAAQYCKETGKLANAGCPSIATGYYDKNHMPENCKNHSGANADNNTEQQSESENAESVPETELEERSVEEAE